MIQLYYPIYFIMFIDNDDFIDKDYILLYDLKECKLIYKDTKFLDYVIVHELSHFIHFDHSKAFWELVGENEPNYKRLRKELQE